MAPLCAMLREAGLTLSGRGTKKENSGEMEASVFISD